MSEDDEPDWLAELAKSTEALRRRIDQGSETLRRQVELLGRAAEQFIRGGRQSTPGIGPVPPFQRRVVRAADAMMGELLPPREPVVHHVTLSGTITMNGSLALQPLRFVADGDVATASENGSVEELDSRRRGLAGPSNGQILALVLVWLIAYAFPIYLYSQSPTPSTLINADLATFAIAYEITCRILDKRK